MLHLATLKLKFSIFGGNKQTMIIAMVTMTPKEEIKWNPKNDWQV